MKKFRALLCICLCCLLLTGILSGCGAANNASPDAMLAVSLVYGDYEGGGKAAPEQTPDVSETPAQTPSETPAASETPAPATQNSAVNDTTAAPANNDTTAPTTAATTAAPQNDAPANNDDTTAPTEAPAPSEQPAADAAPTSKEEIVALYKEAYGKIATDATGAVHTWNNSTNQPQVVEAGALSSVASTLMNMFLKENTPNEQLSPADVPPKGVTTCNLDMNYVGDATCTDNGGTYTVTIKLNTTQDSPEVNPAPGSGGIGSICDVIETKSITDAAGTFIKFEGLENRYFEGEITATIEKETKHITEIHVKSPSFMCFGKAQAVIGFPKIENARLGLTYEDKFTISY